MIEQTGERFYLGELLRLKGEIAGRKGDAAAAECRLREAIELSRRQGAKLFELRSLVSLCRHLGDPRQEPLARDTVVPLLDWFCDDGNSPDIRDARGMLTGAIGTAIGH